MSNIISKILSLNVTLKIKEFAKCIELINGHYDVRYFFRGSMSYELDLLPSICSKVYTKKVEYAKGV